MDLKLLKRYQIRPSKRLGQNFLVDKGVIKKIIEAAELRPEDFVLEVGPGMGVLTMELAKKVKEVAAIEKDLKMVEILKENLKDFKNIKIIRGDILKTKLPKGDYKIVANIPYYLTSPLIRKFLEAKNRPKLMVLMVQKEVAQRICAKPPEMSILAVSVQFYARPEIISFISKKSFWPRPKVDSAILRIAPQINTDRKRINTDLFFKILKAGFSQPRKQILNNLANGLKLNKEAGKSWLLKNNIQPTQRAETLTIEDWVKLTKNFKMEQ